MRGWGSTWLLGAVVLASAGCGGADEQEAANASDERIAAAAETLCGLWAEEADRGSAARSFSDVRAEASSQLLDSAEQASAMAAARQQCPEPRDAFNAARRSAVEERQPEPEDSPATDEAGPIEALYAACDGGDMEACDDLYMDSEWDSEEEAFGATCGNRREDRAEGVWCEDVFPPGGGSGRSTARDEDQDAFFAMTLVWEALTPDEQRTLCSEVGKGMQEAIDVGRVIADSSGGTVTATEAAAFLRTVC